MNYSKELEDMCVVKKGVNHGPAPIPEEGKWVVLAGVHHNKELAN